MPGIGFATALGAITLVGPLAIHLFLPVMPAVKSAFAISNALVEFTFSITLFTMAVVTLVYGSLSDRYGRRPVLLGGLALFVIGTAIATAAGSIAMFVFGRFVQAIGAGCSLTLSRAIARDAYGAAALVKAIAYLTIAYTLGPTIAPALGGILLDQFGWRAPFLFALLSGIAIFVGAYFVLYETRGATPAGSHAPALRHYAALLRHGRFLAYILQSGFMSSAFFAIAAASPFLMKNLLGETATEYGLYFLFFPLGYITGNLISSRLSGRAPVDHMVLTGSLVAFAVVAGQGALILAGHLSPLLIFVPGGMISFSQGLSLPNAQAGAMRIASSLAGTAAGIGVFAQMFLGAVASELYGIFANGTPQPMVALAIGGSVLALSSAVAAFVLGRRGDRADRPGGPPRPPATESG